MNKNLLFKGNSIEVLKKIKDKFQMIYIDPPYNTNRKDMVYNDNRSNEEFISLLTETIYNSYNLLEETGNIFVSISGKNIHLVRNVLDSIYGENNFQATMIRVENAKKQKIGKTSLKENYEYVVVYSKNKEKSIIYNIEDENYLEYLKETNILFKKIPNELFIENLLEMKNIQINMLDINILKSLRKIWTLQEKKPGLKQYKYFHKGELFRAADINMYMGKGYDYNLIHPITNKICNKPKYGYPLIDKFSNEWELIENNLVFKGTCTDISENKIICGNIILNKDEKKIPDYANKLDIEQIPDTIINITGSDDRYLTKLFGVKVFDYPKPIKLLDYLIKIGSKEGDNILDFFAGTGTTGESAFKNKRNFTLIQKEEILEEKIIIENNNILNTVFDITYNRLLLSKVDFSITN